MSEIGRQSARKASSQTREDLLRFLEAPLGTVVVARRPTPSGDVLVVRMVSPNAVPADRRLKEFRGFDVDYETVGPVKAGRW